ncbi:transposase [Methylococcus capsulatus]|nr:transposase [Methylococcus capsulatus]
MSADTRMGWIEREGGLALVRQCALAGVARATYHGRQETAMESEEDLLLCRLIDEEYTRRPFYGRRRMVVYLGRQGHVVNRKRVQRLMRLMGLAGMAPGPATSVKHPEHRVYPYLPRGIEVTPQPGVEHGHHLHPAGAWLRGFGGDHRLVLVLWGD